MTKKWICAKHRVEIEGLKCPVNPKCKDFIEEEPIKIKKEEKVDPKDESFWS